MLKVSVGTPVWNAPDSLTSRVGNGSYSEAQWRVLRYAQSPKMKCAYFEGKWNNS